MLFIESRTLDHYVDGPARLLLLGKLQEKGTTPLIRTSRLNCYQQALLGPERVNEMERTMAAWTESESKTSYTRGDLFCLDDYVLFLVFGEAQGESGEVRAGIVYETRTVQPLRKLQFFCRDISDSLGMLRSGFDERISDIAPEMPQWRQGKPFVQQGFKHFVAKHDVDSLFTSVRRETTIQRIRAAQLLEDPYTRHFLRRTKEAHIEGCTPKLLVGEQMEAPAFSTDRLLDVGLLQREVLVSCRQTGHTLLRLPSPEAVAVVTVSHAMCSECGTAVANERIEEALVPTPLAYDLLEDGSWLINRLLFTLREMGIPDSEIAIGAPTGDGEAHMMVNVCGESFLLVLRDGDLTPAVARRVIDLEIEVEAAHLIIVATGRIHNEGRVRLFDFAHRRVRGGNEIELMIVDGVDAAAPELRAAFERVSQSALAEQLCDLEMSFGLDVSQMISIRFQLLQQHGQERYQGALLASASSAESA